MKKILTSISGLILLIIIPAPMEVSAQFKDSIEANNAADRIQRGPRKYWAVKGIDTIPFKIKRDQTYDLTKLDSKLTGKAIAWHLLKESIFAELANRFAETNYLYDCMHEDVKAVLHSIILIEPTNADWGKERLTLTAETNIAISRIGIAPKIRKLCVPDTLNEIQNELSFATDAMAKIFRMQKKAAKYGNVDDLNKPYLQAVNQLIAADQLEKGRYFANADKAQLSIAAYTRAIENLPKISAAYRNRGAIYTSIGDESNALKDIMTAAQLGDNRAQNYLSSKGIEWHIK